MDIVVFGTHYSGTSALAAAFQGFGYSVVEPHIRTLNCLESAPVLKINKDVLEELGTTWWDPLSIPSAAVTQNFVDRAAALLDRQDADAALVIHDRNIGPVADIWLKALDQSRRDVGCIHVIRQPREVAGALRDVLPPHYAMLAWLKHVLGAEHATRGRPRTFVTHEDLSRDWKAAVDRIALDLKIKPPQATWAQRSRIVRRLAGELERDASESASSGYAPIDRECDQAWAALSALVSDGADQAAWLALDQVRDRVYACGDLMRPLLNEPWSRRRDRGRRQPHRNGTRLFFVHACDIWVVYHGQRHHVSDSTYEALFVDRNGIQPVATLADLEEGPRLAEGACLIRSKQDIFLLNLDGDHVVKHLITTYDDFDTFGFDITKVRQLPELVVAGLPDGRDLRVRDDRS